MLGLPETSSPAGLALLALGLVLALIAAHRARQRMSSRGILATSLLACLALTFGVGPFLVWRVVEDIRYTTSLDANYRNGAGPIQAFLRPYFLDDVPALIPRSDTYYAIAGSAVPYATARKAFPLLALDKLFPRRSAATAREADYIVAWGVAPSSLAPVGPVRVASPASGSLPPLFVARVRR
jgi:hypothetical protein